MWSGCLQKAALQLNRNTFVAIQPLIYTTPETGVSDTDTFWLQVSEWNLLETLRKFRKVSAHEVYRLSLRCRMKNSAGVCFLTELETREVEAKGHL